jgi:glycosyltransferase involved in cell wall biosynthesis
MNNPPSISIVIPTLNCEKLLKQCLESIENQDYPKNKIEIIIADGGSKDNTLKTARKYTRKIFSNPLKTAEAGKAVGVKKAKNDLIAFIDSDNILPEKDWLKKMVKPFEDDEIVGSEPLYYTYRKTDPITTRYFALLGMSDPLCLFIGNYDRYCYITGKWTEMQVKQQDKGEYLKIELNEKQIPTIGANGFIIRRKLIKNFKGDYLFDIDLVYNFVKNGENKFAKVKTGIIHLFSTRFSTFFKKQNRRIKDYLYYSKLKKRDYNWNSKRKTIVFAFSTLLILPIVYQAFKGYKVRKDSAWALHFPACFITLIIYSLNIITNFFKSKPMTREEWGL